MTESPLAKRIIATLRRVGQGNGFAAKDVTLVREEAGRYKLDGILSATLDVQVKSRQEPGRPAGVHVFAGREDMEAEIARAREELTRSPQAAATLQKTLLAKGANSFGAADKTIPVTGLSYDFALMSTCPTCKGIGRGGCPVCQGKGRVVCPQCRGQKEEWCGQCRGTGKQNGDASSAVLCTWCNGIGRTNCLRCTGTGEISCVPCSGTGHAHCKSCMGAGEIADIAHLDFVWRSQFRTHGRDMPSAVGHLLAKAPLGQLAALGHIAPKQVAGPLAAPPQLDDAIEEDENGEPVTPKGQTATLYYHFQADVPWSESTVKMAGAPAFIATAAGLKGRVNLCPNFLDKRLDGAARLRKEALGETLRRGPRFADRILAKQYQVGLSEKARRHVIKEAQNEIHKNTRALKLSSWAAGLLAAFGIAYFLKGGEGAAAGFFAGLAVFQVLAIAGKYLFAKKAGLVYKPEPHFGWELLALLVAAAAPYALSFIGY